MRRTSANEAYEFEREVERDPFLYEAVEGFEQMLSSELQQAMDELDDRLDAKLKPAINWTSIKMAATILLTIGIGVSLYFVVFNNGSNTNEVVKSPTETHGYEPREFAVKFDSLGSLESNEHALENESVETDAEVVRGYAAVEDEMNLKALPAEKPLKTELEKNESYAWSEAQEEKATKLKSNKAEESVEALDKIAASSSATTDGFTSSKQILENRDKSGQTISASESVSMMEEKATPKFNTVPELDQSSDEQQPKLAKPSIGATAYEAYIKRNIKVSEGMPRGSVSLSFELDRNGKPKKIQVVKSLCAACDAEAIRLLENGPTWESEDKKAGGSVDIQFP